MDYIYYSLHLKFVDAIKRSAYCATLNGVCTNANNQEQCIAGNTVVGSCDVAGSVCCLPNSEYCKLAGGKCIPSLVSDLVS